MSDWNIKMVQRVYDAFARRDLDAVLILLDTDFEVWQSETLPWGGSYRGLQEFQDYVNSLARHINATIKVGDLLDAGDAIVMVGRSQGTTHTGARFDIPVVHVWTSRGDKLARLEAHLDTARMLQALANQEDDRRSNVAR